MKFFDAYAWYTLMRVGKKIAPRKTQEEINQIIKLCFEERKNAKSVH